jgi:beta-1,4-N-acetylglucosaminyltransferase
MIPEKNINGDGINRKICLVCSSGGHLLLLYRLKEWWQYYERFWVSFKKADVIFLLKNEKVYNAYYPTNRNIKNLIRNTLRAIQVLLKERPAMIVSSGAGIAVPFFYIGKCLGCKLIYIEAYERFESASLTGKLVYPITDAFVLQWNEQKIFYPKGIVLGQIL